MSGENSTVSHLPSIKKIPQSIYVNGEEYVVITLRGSIPEAPNCVGLCDDAEKIIWIRLDQKKNRTENRKEVWATFIHEILHAIECEYCGTVPHRFINTLEKGLINLWIDNFL